MPTPSTAQTHMKLYNGMAPCVDANGVIDDISYKVYVITKVADYTVLASESGAWFTTSGATADVEFTLPTNADGLIYYFFNGADHELKVTADTADTMMAFNDVAADSVAYTTSNEHVGGAFVCFADGTNWFVAGLLGADSQTITVAT